MPIRAITRIDQSVVPSVPSPPARQRVRPSVATTTPSRSDKPAYAVGYGKPPKETRFKSGQSGNPNGRPKDAKGMKTLVKALLTEKVAVRTPGGTKRMSKMEAALHKVAEKAFTGDIRSLELLIRLYSSSVPDELPAALATARLAVERSEQEDAALAALQKVLRDELSAQPQGEA